MNKGNWIILIVVNIIMGFCGYVLMAFGYLTQIAAGKTDAVKIYLVLAAIGLALLLVFFAANRIIYRVFSERSREEIPGRIAATGNITAWITLVCVYILMALL